MNIQALPQKKERGRTWYETPCSNQGCPEKRWLKASDARKNSQCFRCAQREKSVKGFKATCKKHGSLFAIEKVQAYQLEHPSSLNRQTMTILDEMGIHYEREVLLEGTNFLIDFVINGCHAIEVNGAWAHSHHQQRDQHKFNLIRNAGYRLLPLDERDMPNARAIIADFLRLSPVVA